MGAWCGYGLGSQCQELPGFVVLNGGLIPVGGLDCFNSGFLPATFQGSIFDPSDSPSPTSAPASRAAEQQRNKLALLRQIDARAVEHLGAVDQVESAIANYELAYRMQSAVPELVDLRDETADNPRGLRPGCRVQAHGHFRPAMPARPPAGRAGRAIHRADLPAIAGGRPLGPAQYAPQEDTKTMPARSISRSPPCWAT